MSEKVSPIPDGFTPVTPHLVVEGAADAMEFYKRAFGAEEVMRLPAADGKRLMHAEIRIDGARVMLADAFPEFDSRSPKSLGGSAVAIHLYVGDVDAVFARAVEAGATVTMPLADMFWGDRYGRVTDPFGHHWSLATHVADPSPEEMQKAMEEACASQGQ